VTDNITRRDFLNGAALAIGVGFIHSLDDFGGLDEAHRAVSELL
jgi:hypothetical protein